MFGTRLILSSVRKLRDYSVPKLYIREDFSPEDRATRHANFTKSKPVSEAEKRDAVESATECNPVTAYDHNDHDDHEPKVN